MALAYRYYRFLIDFDIVLGTECNSSSQTNLEDSCVDGYIEDLIKLVFF